MERVADAVVDRRGSMPALPTREVGGHDRHLDDLRRVVALVGAADELVAEAQREDDLGGRREEGHDAHRRKPSVDPLRQATCRERVR